MSNLFEILNLVKNEFQLNFVCAKWATVAYELATEDCETESPAELGIEKFVGSAHFVSGDLIIKSHSTKDLLATKQFRSGDILLQEGMLIYDESFSWLSGIKRLGDAFVLRENNVN